MLHVFVCYLVVLVYEPGKGRNSAWHNILSNFSFYGFWNTISLTSLHLFHSLQMQVLQSTHTCLELSHLTLAGPRCDTAEVFHGLSFGTFNTCGTSLWHRGGFAWPVIWHMKHSFFSSITAINQGNFRSSSKRFKNKAMDVKCLLPECNIYLP